MAIAHLEYSAIDIGITFMMLFLFGKTWKPINNDKMLIFCI